MSMTDKWIKKMWYVRVCVCVCVCVYIYAYIYIYIYAYIYVCIHTHTVEYYSAIKKNEIMPFASKWMQPEISILSESGRER